MAIDILTLALAKKMSGSSGGSAIQSDWNQNDETASDYIKNRTHYEKTAFEPIVWDGNTDGLEVFSPSDSVFLYRVADYFPVADEAQIENAIWVESVSGGEESFVTGTVEVFNEHGCSVHSNNVVISDGQFEVNNVVSPNGVWFRKQVIEKYGYVGYVESLNPKNAVIPLDPKYLPDSAKSDWNQNDASQPSYVKNRPFYEETAETVLFKEHTAIFVANEPYQLPPPVTPIDFSPDNPLFNGTTLRIVWDGVAYDCVTVDGLAGNGKLLDIPDLGNGEPFFFDFETFYVYEGGEHTFSVSIVEETVHKLDPKYIKDMYYTETVQKSQTREFDGELVDAEFASLLFENRQTAKYIINGVPYTFKQDEQVPTGYLWIISSADGTEGTISIAGDNDVILATDATSITVKYEEETIHKLDAKYLPDSAKSDWNQNDPTAPDYIKNRPFWTGDPVEKTLFNNDFDIDNLCYDGTPLGLEIGKTYTVCLNEDSYDVVCVGIDGGCFLGNGSLQDIGEDTGEPFVVIESVDHNVFSACVAESYFIQLLESGKDPIVSLEIFGSHKEVTTIDAKYLPVGGRMRRGAMSFGDVVPTEGFEIFVGTTTYASFINHLQSSAIPIFYLNEQGLGGNAMTALVFSYSSSRLGEIGNEVCCVTLSVFDLTYGFSGKIYVTFPLNADNAVDDDSAVESIQFSAPESMVLKSSTAGSEKKFKITVDDSGTLKATELT